MGYGPKHTVIQIPQPALIETNKQTNKQQFIMELNILVIIYIIVT